MTLGRLVLVAVACWACAATPRIAGAPATVTFTTAQDQFTQLGNVRLRFRDIGRGDPVVLVHGYAGSLDFWGALPDSLARTHRVVALDLRGFGGSAKVLGPTNFGRPMADDVIALMNQLGIRRAHLIGHSMGAVVVADLALRYPARVRTAGLLAGPFYTDSAALARTLAPYVEDLRQGRGLERFLRFVLPTWPDSMVAGFAQSMGAANDRTVLIDALEGFPALMVTADRAAAARIPTVAIVGTDDPLWDESQWLARHWPRARLVEIVGADHVVQGRPETLTALRELLRR